MNSDISAKDRFDEMMINIGSYMFDLQMMLARFVSEILEEFEGNIYDIDLTVPFQEGNEYINLHVERIIFDTDDVIKVFVSMREEFIEWDNLNITVQDLIANYLHMRYKAENLYRNLSEKDEIH